MKTYKKNEELKKDMPEKQVFYYVDEKEELNVLSREVYKKRPLEVHYPFKKDGGPKYKYIKSVEFHNISPSLIKGVLKSPKMGLGFTRYLSPVVYELEKFENIQKIIISKNDQSYFDKKSITFNICDLEKMFRCLKPFKDVQSSKLKTTSNNLLSEIFPEKIKEVGHSYTKNELGIFIRENKLTPDELSEKDVESVISLIPKNISTEKVFFQAEEKINFIKLNKIKEDFNKLLNQKTDTSKLEEKCQQFFKKNSWVLSNILSVPVAILKDKAYVGGKDYKDTGGRIADFLYSNKFTKNVCVIEIKTPLKKIIDAKTPYRKPDVFSLGKELTGGIVQVLDQKDNLQKDFYKLSQGDEFKSFNPKVLLVIGRISSLTSEQLKSFELFRGNIKDVEVVTFDELNERTDIIFGNFLDNKK